MKALNLILNYRFFVVLMILFNGVVPGVLHAVCASSDPNCNTNTGANGSGLDLLTSTLCGIVDGVRAVVGVIALAMFLLGGVLYAIGHFLPAAGNVKASMQGWAMGMIVGGVIGVILVILAPFIVTTVMSFGSSIPPLPANC